MENDLSLFQLILTWIGCFIFLAIGVLWIVWPEAVQRYAISNILRYRDNPFHKVMMRLPFVPSQKYIESRAYIIVTRLSGVVCVVCGLLMAYLLLKR